MKQTPVFRSTLTTSSQLVRVTLKETSVGCDTFRWRERSNARSTQCSIYKHWCMWSSAWLLHNRTTLESIFHKQNNASSFISSDAGVSVLKLGGKSESCMLSLENIGALKVGDVEFSNIECYLCRILKRWTAMCWTLPHRSIIELVVSWTA